eukprot:SAG31_NODE_532_length_14374_cov_30.565254_11_plen_134_part_00
MTMRLPLHLLVYFIHSHINTSTADERALPKLPEIPGIPHLLTPDVVESVLHSSALVLFIKDSCVLCDQVYNSRNVWIEKLPIATTLWTANSSRFPELGDQNVPLNYFIPMLNQIWSYRTSIPHQEISIDCNIS